MTASCLVVVCSRSSGPSSSESTSLVPMTSIYHPSPFNERVPERRELGVMEREMAPATDPARHTSQLDPQPFALACQLQPVHVRRYVGHTSLFPHSLYKSSRSFRIQRKEGGRFHRSSHRFAEPLLPAHHHTETKLEPLRPLNSLGHRPSAVRVFESGTRGQCAEDRIEQRRLQGRAQQGRQAGCKKKLDGNRWYSSQEQVGRGEKE